MTGAKCDTGIDSVYCSCTHCRLRYGDMNGGTSDIPDSEPVMPTGNQLLRMSLSRLLAELPDDAMMEALDRFQKMVEFGRRRIEMRKLCLALVLALGFVAESQATGIVGVQAFVGAPVVQPFVQTQFLAQPYGVQSITVQPFVASPFVAQPFVQSQFIAQPFGVQAIAVQPFVQTAFVRQRAVAPQRQVIRQRTVIR